MNLKFANFFVPNGGLPRILWYITKITVMMVAMEPTKRYRMI